MQCKIQARANNEAEILLYDVIGAYDERWNYIGAKWFVSELKKLGDISNITVRINSVGGSIFEAQAIYSYLKTYPATKTVRIDGLAASAASVVAMAGDKVFMPKNALMMIHNPSLRASGEADDMRDAAEILDKIRDTIVSAYSAKTGLTAEKLISMMNEETWMSADEAFALKFCDEVTAPIEIVASAARQTPLNATSWNTSSGAANVSPQLIKIMPAEFKNISLKEELDVAVNNIAELTQAYPELVQDIRNQAAASADNGYEKGVTDERARIQALDALASEGREEIINKAKYEEPKDARDIAIELLAADKNTTVLNNRRGDANDCNSAAAPQAVKKTSNEEAESFMNKTAEKINNMRGHKGNE